jgi:hypothetical protein
VKQGIAAVRRLLDPPLEADAPPIEIRAAVLEQIERQVASVGVGARVFPHGLVRVRVLAADAAALAAFELVFADFDERVQERLREIRCDVPDGFGARVTLLEAPPPEWLAEQRFDVAFARKNDAPAPAAPRIPPLAIGVVHGTATKESYRFQVPVILIGRTAVAMDTRGRARRNHVAFDERTAGVSRAHARIVFDEPRREYRVLDEGSAKGTRIVRGDAVIDVRPRRQDARGVRLESGDEIHLADAALRVTID